MKNLIIGSVLVLILVLILYFAIGPNIIFYVISSIAILALCAFTVYEVKEYSRLQDLSNKIDEIFEKYAIISGGKIGGANINDLPYDIIEHILNIIPSLNDVLHLLQTNKNLNTNIQEWSRHILVKRRVNYENPNSIIYAYNKQIKTPGNSYFNMLTLYASVDMLIKLDISHNTHLNTFDFSNITYLPNLEILYLGQNRSQTLPFEKLPNLKTLVSSSLKRIENFPNLEELDASWYPYLGIYIGNLPNLKRLKLEKTFDVIVEKLPKLEQLIIYDSRISSPITDVPKLNNIIIDDSRNIVNFTIIGAPENVEINSREGDEERIRNLITFRPV